MIGIREKHWSEQKLCQHGGEPVFARREQSNGVVQVLRVCGDCGFVRSTALPHAEHPNRAKYPHLERHPHPCECHPAARPLAALDAEVRVGALDETELKSIERGPIERPDYAVYIASEEWQVRARYYKARALNRCQLCSKPGGPNGRGLDAHHRTYARLGAELDIDIIVLCRECHKRHHAYIGEHSEAA